MEFKIYNGGKGGLKVTFFSNHSFPDAFEHRNILSIAKYNNLEIHLFVVPKSVIKKYYISQGGRFKENNFLNEKQDIKEMYNFITEYIKDNGIDICIFFSSVYLFTPNFLKSLGKISYLACYFADDPEGSERSSRPFVKYFDYAFCAGIYFDDKTRIKDKYIEWGARKSKFIPLGIMDSKYKKIPSDLNKRDIDLIYIGRPYRTKLLRLLILKRHYGNRMQIYGGGWDSKNTFEKIIIKLFMKIGGIKEIKKVSDEELVDLYQRTKIGFNFHQSFGPSNIRMYELPANEVMQICDCEKGVKELYEPGKEIVTYNKIGEAIKKIDFYLKHQDERIAIAMVGFNKSMKYKIEESFRKIIDEIIKDMKEQKK